MELPEIGIEGIALSADGERFLLASATPLRILSSSIVGGDLAESRYILSVRVPADPVAREFALKRPRAYMKERAQALGISEPLVGLMTGLDHHRLQVATCAEGGTRVAALCTVGLTYLSAPGRHGVVYRGDTGAGTINLVVLLDARVSPIAALRAATLATEAKALVLFENGVKTPEGSIATGTSMDTIVVASTGRGTFFRYAGTSTLIGDLIGRAVYEAVSAGVRLEQSGPTAR